MGKAVEKEKVSAIKDGLRLTKSPFSQDRRWAPFRMGLRGEQAHSMWRGVISWATPADASLMCQVWYT